MNSPSPARKTSKTFFFLSAMAQMTALSKAVTEVERNLILSTPVRKKSRAGTARPSGVLKAKRAAKKVRNRRRMK